MNKPHPENSITVSCPSGHRLRGGPEMVGKKIKCPKCQTPFVFSPTNSKVRDHRAITDTGVMRILGDMPQVPELPQPNETDHRAVTDTRAVTDARAVTDTGVMRILGDESPSPTQQSAEAATRPCSRCGIAIQESLAVCPHCNCYIGVMPTFMQSMTGNPKTSDK